jgi:hypothetical protein
VQCKKGSIAGIPQTSNEMYGAMAQQHFTAKGRTDCNRRWNKASESCGITKYAEAYTKSSAQNKNPFNDNGNK